MAAKRPYMATLLERSPYSDNVVYARNVNLDMELGQSVIYISVGNEMKISPRDGKIVVDESLCGQTSCFSTQ